MRGGIVTKVGAVETLTLTEFLLARIAEDEQDAECVLWDNGQGNVESYESRVLAECDAKRRIVEEWRRAESLIDTLTQADQPDVDEWEAQSRALEVVLRTIAAVYADHPDYNEEWSA